MVIISQVTFSRAFSRTKEFIFWFKSHWFVPKGPVDNAATLVQVTVWRRKGNKPLSKTMLTRFTDAYMRHGGRWVKTYTEINLENVVHGGNQSDAYICKTICCLLAMNNYILLFFKAFRVPYVLCYNFNVRAMKNTLHNHYRSTRTERRVFVM